MGRIIDWAVDFWDATPGGKWVRGGVFAFLLYLVACVPVGIYWSQTPDSFEPSALAEADAQAKGVQRVTGYTTIYTVDHLVSDLLNKPGGYISNDRLPPGLVLDNIKHWEFGVLVQVRDLSRALRKDFSRSQSQSVENLALTTAEPQFHFDSNSWWLPSSESQYQEGRDALAEYWTALADPAQGDAQFYARADNLSNWLADVQTRLGSLSQRLSASVGQERINTDLAGEAAASQSTTASGVQLVKTPWTEIDDVFFEARGATYALLHILKAVEQDFAPVLAQKNAAVSVQQIIRELEATQDTVWSPVILNGGGFGLFANHSLVMANYISRANAALIDLRELLDRG